VAAVGLSVAPALSAESENIRIGISPDAAYSTFVVADAEGCFQRQGLKASVIRFASGSEMADAVNTGDVDFAAGGAGTTLPRLMTGRQKILALLGTSSTNFAMAARDGLKVPADFIGKRLGVVPGTTSEYLWGQFLKQNNIAASAVKFVPAPPPELIAGMTRGDIDAFYLWSPWPQRAQAAIKNVRVFQNSSALGYVLYFTIVGNTSVIQTRPESTEKMLRAIKCGVDAIAANPEKAVTTMATLMKMSVADTAPLMQVYEWAIAAPDAAVRKDLMDFASWLKENGKLRGEVDVDQMIDATAVKKVSTP
jgi:NitT/TauT family transport system substrate-binding protein